MNLLETNLPVSIKTKSKFRSNWISGYGMLIPSFILMLLFSFYPPIMAIIYSFMHWDGFNPPSFVGIHNYLSILHDNIFWISMGHLGIWSALKLIFEVIVPLIVAVVIYHLKNQRAQYIYRVLFVVPMVVPAVVQLMIWSFIYDPNVGVLNTLLTSLGLKGLILNWLGSPRIALYALVFVGFPFVIPFNLLIFYAGLQNIPESVYDATRLDGVKKFRRLLQIEFPLVLGQVKLLMILTVITLLQNIMMPLIMTNGGPGYSTYIPGLYMYFDAFQNGQFGLAMAVAMIIFVIVLILTLIQVKFIRPSTEYEA